MAHEHDGEKSRSQVKREFRELRQLGLRLAELSSRRLDSVPLTERTREAVIAARSMTRAALQRQSRFITSLLADEDVDAVRDALADAERPHRDEVAALHEAESLRDALLDEGDPRVTALIERYPTCDRTQLRQLVRNARKERELGKPPKSARQLFRFIRELIETA